MPKKEGLSMINRIIGIVMVLCAGFFVFVAVKAVVEIPKTNKQFKDAPFITDGKVDPENEGKTVIVKLSLDNMDGAVDELMGLSFSYPIVQRKVETYNKTMQGYAWENVQEEEEVLKTEYLYGAIEAGDFEIDPSLLISLGAGKDLRETDFDAQELSDFFAYYNGLQGVEYKGRYYITDTSHHFVENVDDSDVDVLNEDYYTSEVGKTRLFYQGLNTDDIQSVAIIGRQEGNRLVKDDRVDSVTTYTNVEEKDDLMRKASFTLIIGIALGILICATVIYFGVRKIIEG